MKKKFSLSTTQIILLSFLITILLGSILLSLPISTASKISVPYIDALFTATTATCVTGLVTLPTATTWSIFGQVVILLLIQIGGLGVITIMSGFMLMINKRMGIGDRLLIQDAFNLNTMSGLASFVKKILLGTFIIEGIGSLLYMTVFIPEFGARGIWISVFNSISAFCNGGFDLMGEKGAFSSLTWYSGDMIVNLTVMSLIIIGGAGFLVWDDIYQNKKDWKRYHLQTKIVLSVSGILLFGGGTGFLILEWNHLGADMSLGEKLLTALFQSCTARTAGFNTIDTAALSEGSRILTIVLMFIGGSPGSTAGGIKTTTIAVLLLYAFASVRHEQDAHFFGRSLEADVLQKAVAVFVINLLFVMTGALLICGLQPESMAADIFFETFSAMGTVGMSTGITRDLRPICCYIIIFLMYSGRVGSVSFAVALLEKKARPPVTFPKEKITIG